MSLKQEAIRGIFWSLIQRWGGQATTFTVFLLLARLLEPQAFGLVALASVVIGFIQVFVDQGFWDAIVQRPSLDPEHLDTAFWVNIGIGTLLTITTVACAGPVAVFFKEPALAAVIRWLSLSFIVTALSSVQAALLTREMKFKALAIRELLGILVGGIVGVVMALLGFGVWSLVGKQLADATVNVIVLCTVSKWRPGFRVSLGHSKELFRYGINVVGLRILSFFNRRSGEVLIGYFLGSIALGYYTIAYRILSIFIDIMIGAIQKLAFPVFSRLQHDSEKLRLAFFNAIEFTTLIAFPVFLGLFALTPEIVVVIFGEQWKPSIPVMQILGLVGVVSAVMYYNDPILMALGKPHWSLRLVGLSAAVNLTFFAVAVRWGIIAVAAAFVLRACLMLPIQLWVVNKVLPFKWTEYLRRCLPQLIAGLVMTFFLLAAKYLVNDTMTVKVLVPTYIVFGAAIYGVTVVVLAPQMPDRVVELFHYAMPQSVLKHYRISQVKQVGPKNISE